MKTSIFDISRGPLQKGFAFVVIGAYCTYLVVADIWQEIWDSRR